MPPALETYSHPPVYGPVLRMKDLRSYIRLGETRIYELLRDPVPQRRLPPPYKIGRANLWRREDIDAWLARQPVARMGANQPGRPSVR